MSTPRATSSEQAPEDPWRTFCGSLALPVTTAATVDNFKIGDGEVVSIKSDDSHLVKSLLWDKHTSTLEPHHKVSICYPSLEILRDGETAHLLKPENAAGRYQPLPLVPDDDVIKQAGCENQSETNFFSLYRTLSDLPPTRQYRGNHHDDVDVFEEKYESDMRETVRHMGDTRLRVLIYKPANPDNDMLRIRIIRDSHFRYEGGHVQIDAAPYEWILPNFLRLKDTSRWHQDMLHLLEMKNDRAVRHVQLRLHVYMTLDLDMPVNKKRAVELYESFSKSFKPRRQPYYARYLKSDAPPSEAKRLSSLWTKDNKPCKICKKHFKASAADHIPMALPCCGKPIGRSCLITFCEPAGPDKACCPRKKCGKHLFTDPKVLHHLKFNVVDGLYKYDSRLTAFENFDRSCADLDKQLSNTTDAVITINPELFMEVWNTIVTCGSREDELPHLNPVTCPEFHIIEEVFFYHLSRLDGITISVKFLEGFFALEVYREFRQRFQKAGLDAYLLPGERSWMGKGSVKSIAFRDGLMEFVGRGLNRTLRFHTLRACECKGRSEIHFHGDREYYNPQEYGKYLSQDRQEMREWQKTKQGRNYLRDVQKTG